MNQELPLSGLNANAITIHEVYTSLVDAGFDDEQAIYLVGQMLEGAFFRG